MRDFLKTQSDDGILGVDQLEKRTGLPKGHKLGRDCLYGSLRGMTEASCVKNNREEFIVRTPI